MNAPAAILPTLAAIHAARRGGALHVVVWRKRDARGLLGAPLRLEFETLPLAQAWAKAHAGAELISYRPETIAGALRDQGVLV